MEENLLALESKKRDIHYVIIEQERALSEQVETLEHWKEDFCAF